MAEYYSIRGKGAGHSVVHLRLAECLFEWRIGKDFRVGWKEYGQGQWKQNGGGERWDSSSMNEGSAGMEGMRERRVERQRECGGNGGRVNVICSSTSNSYRKRLVVDELEGKEYFSAIQETAVRYLILIESVVIHFTHAVLPL